MSNFVFELPTRVVFGPGAVEAVGREAAACGKHALVVTGSTFAKRSGLIDHLHSSLSAAEVKVTLFDRLDQNPTVEAIDEGARVARETGASVVIGLGGGSALDAAKAIAATAAGGKSVWEFTRRGPEVVSLKIEDALPIVQVPIIASTGSETNNTAVIYNPTTHTKASIEGPLLFARVAIVDPALTFSVPARYTAVGAINILSQIVEGYLTSDEFAVTDRVSEGLVRAVMDNLARAIRHGDDLDARTNLSWAATMASTVALAGRAGTMPLRSLAYPLTARFPIEHGVALAALWPSYMRYALANRLRLPSIGRFKRYALLGRQLFGVHETDDEIAAEITTLRLADWFRSMDMPCDLRGFGIDEEDLAALADQTVRVSGHGNGLPSGLTSRDVEHIYEGALRAA